MLTPDGKLANKIDKIMLLAMWAKHVAREQGLKAGADVNPMIYAGMGKPTYPLHPDTRKFLEEYWHQHNGEAIDYGDPQGDLEARELMASAMSAWYDFKIKPSEVLFTVGGAGALHAIFAALKAHVKTPKFRVITPFPYYSLYAENDLLLHPIHVMNNPGYRFNAESLHNSILSANELAKKDKAYPRALLFCDPNNPLGSVVGERELKRMAQVLREHPDLTIILDEAYAEMVLDGTKHVSLLSVAPDLKERMIIMRSATKGLSAAGERMAITLAFNPSLMGSILEYGILSYGHAPRSLQMAYAKTMSSFTDKNRISINNFYRQKVDYVSKRLFDMGAAMPDKDYQVKGTFYVLGDFSDSFGQSLPPETVAALGRVGTIKTDEDLAYKLLFNDSLMVSPASYYGVDKKKGYLRITCSAEQDKLQLLMDRLEEHLKQSRLSKQARLKQDITEQLAILSKLNPRAAAQVPQATDKETLCTVTTLELKNENQALELDLLGIKRLIKRETFEGKAEAVTLIQSTYRGYKARKNIREITKQQDSAWCDFVARVSPHSDEGLGAYLRQLSVTERLELAPWRQHLKEKSPQPSAHFFLNVMGYGALRPYIALLAFVGLASGVVSCLGLASFGALSLTAASIACVGAAVTGYRFFSYSSHATSLKNIASDKPLDAVQSGLGLG